jgi:preprotein translocase subunit SecF
MKIPNPYEKPYYKFYILISVVVFIISLSLLPNLKMGIDLKGGTAFTATLEKDVTPDEVEAFLVERGVEGINEPKITENPLTGEKGVIVEFAGNTQLLEALDLANSDDSGDRQRAKELAEPFVSNETANLTSTQYVKLAVDNFNEDLKEDFAGLLGVGAEDVSVNSIGSSIGQMFWETSQRALIIAFVLVALVVFVLFRQPVPSIAVIHAALFDVTLAAAGMSLMNIPITLPTIVALLTILGYSVDSDILLADRIIRRKTGTTAERAFSAMKTGMTMTGTVVIVFTVLVVFSYINQMTTLFQISAVLWCGLWGDLFSTYCTNAVIIKWWVDKNE